MALNNFSIALTVQGLLATALDHGAAQFPFNQNRSIPLASGTGANQADVFWSDHRTIAASSNDDLDLAGSLTPLLGTGTVTFVKVKGILVFADSANTNNVVIGAAAATVFTGPFGGATHTCHVAPGGFAAFARKDATGWAVGAGATDLLRIANGGAGTSVDYDIYIVGTSA